MWRDFCRKDGPCTGRAKISIPDRERQWIEPGGDRQDIYQNLFCKPEGKGRRAEVEYTVVEQNMLPRESKQKESKEEEREECLLVDGYT